MDLVINYPAVLVAAVISMVLGTLWYGPLFGKQWMTALGISKPEVITPEIKKKMGISYFFQFIGALVMAFVYAFAQAAILPHIEFTGVVAGIKIAFVLWAGFIAPALLPEVLWTGRPWKYWFITSGYYLVYLILIAILFSVWH